MALQVRVPDAQSAGDLPVEAVEDGQRAEGM